ncbi:unnamed protein product [Tilletia controversa]|uniref:Sorting nexin MVP1 n=3 Tax=Tilletia TaxID=13289 RepID=A0A177V1V3_9BASI|nr:hypothetical protein CF336_g2093 [Tilletia laevis]KAE8261264.1 hypothetical protein A4X03_0g3408 [Tilletia caries]CAD6962197.1 unnamed protein product [Tilletia controversa]KAE8207113.1 hypothetical protein CF335_g1381 [Tilletia laevis]CAD6886576.1 unnamed protein product [Tilletia caries]
MFNEPRSPPSGSSAIHAWAATSATAERTHTHTPSERVIPEHPDAGEGEGEEQQQQREGLPPSSATSPTGWSAVGAAGQTLANEISLAPTAPAPGPGPGPRLPSTYTRPHAVRTDTMSSHGTAADPWGSSGAAGIAPFAAGGALLSSPSPYVSSGRQLPQRYNYSGRAQSPAASASWGGANSSVDGSTGAGGNGHAQAPVIYSSLKPPAGLPNMPGAGATSGLPPSASAGWNSLGSNYVSNPHSGAAGDGIVPMPTVRLSSSPTSESTNVVVQLFTQHNTYIISTPPSGLVGLADSAIVQHHTDAGRQIEVERRYSDFTWLADILIKRYPFRCLPSLPPKRVTMPLPGPHLSNDNSFLEQRRKGLQRYIRALFCHPVLSKDDVVIVFLSEAQTLTHWRSSRDPPLCPEEAYSHPLTEVEEMSIPSDLIPAKIQRTRAVLTTLVERWRVLTALFDRIARRREAEGLDWKRMSNILGELASMEGRRWRPELVGGGAGAGTLGRAYKRRNERQRASMFASSGPYGAPGVPPASGSGSGFGASARHSSFLAAGMMEPSSSEDGRAGEFMGAQHGGGGFGDESMGEDDLFADNRNATSAEESIRKVARACGDWSEGMKARATSSLSSTLEDIKYQRDLWAAFRDLLHRWDKLGPDNVDAIKRRIEQNQHKLSSLLVPDAANNNQRAGSSDSANNSEITAPISATTSQQQPRANLTTYEQEQVKTLRTALANDAQLVSQLLARRTHTQWVLWNELRYVHDASAEGIRAIWKRWTKEERAFVMEEFGAGLHALEMLLMEL